MPKDNKDETAGPSIVWFRNDLRLADNPALSAAADGPCLAIYILDDETPRLRRMGSASRWWLHHSLASLGKDLKAKGGELLILRGAAEEIVLGLAAAANASSVHWNRRYDEAERGQDERIKARLKAAGLQAVSHNAHLLYEPWEVVGKSGGPLKVFSPFWRAAQAKGPPPPPLPAPGKIVAARVPSGLASGPLPLDALGLRPTKPNWAAEMETCWTPGEAGAQEALVDFLDARARGYGERRNRPDIEGTSRLSPHLRFGEIGPRQVWSAARHSVESGDGSASETDIDKFLSEIGWREFSHHLLFQFPALATKNFQPRFDAFPWREDPEALEAWTRGRTGFPIVDAGMRQLWRTGWMHNRVRMIVASFLVKHLLIDWRRGEEWFWDTLVDACPANNAASWQWVAGSGADAAPYFRVFAPVLQGEKFDPNGDYVRSYVPELAGIPATYIHKPWESPHPIRARAGITLGETYPFPIIKHESGRERALAAFQSLSPESA
jgi:deoxyribodipyrimidine photo-lyase